MHIIGHPSIQLCKIHILMMHM